MVCAHPWEARPFIDLARMKEISRVPFPLYGGIVEDRPVVLTVCGNGASRALMATTAWLARELEEVATGLQAPPLVVANFGTAGAYRDTWEVGQTLLVSKLSPGDRQGAIYPERLVQWDGEEAECRTVDSRQNEVVTADLERDRRPLFDMEAFGVAQSVLTFLSSAHLVVGKCVLDEIGKEEEHALSVADLKERVEPLYRRGAERFLLHALEHQACLSGDPRRLQAQELALQVSQLSELTRELVSLTVSQQRALEQTLRAALSAEADPRRLETSIQSRFGELKGAPKSRLKEALADFSESCLEPR